MSVRNCAEIGPILQEVVSRLMANDNLCRLLYYTDRNPFSSEHEDLTPEQKRELIYEKLIKVVPRVGPKETDKSVVVVRVARGLKNSMNDQFRDLAIYIETFVPLTQWLINDENLRPFLILGEIQKSLDGKRMDQIGKMQGGDFELQVLTEEISCYEQEFVITTYD